MQTEKSTPAFDSALAVALERRPLHQDLADRLRDMISEGSLASGEHIDERRLCKVFGVSRTPFREAIMVLATEGLVELRPRQGARVTALEPERIRELLEVLGGLEALVGELACARASAEEIAMIETKHAEMCMHFKAGDMLAYFKTNEGIHDAIVAAAHNATLVAEHRRLRGRLLHALYLPNVRNSRWRAALGEHEAFLAALKRRDGASLSHLLRRHRIATWEALRDCLPPAMPTPGRLRRLRGN